MFLSSIFVCIFSFSCHCFVELCFMFFDFFSFFSVSCILYILLFFTHFTFNNVLCGEQSPIHIIGRRHISLHVFVLNVYISFIPLKPKSIVTISQWVWRTSRFSNKCLA